MKRRDFLNSSLLAAAVSLPGIRTAYAVVGTGQVPDVAAITGDGREITLRGADIRELAAQMRGPLLLAGDAGYDTARMIMNPSFDKHPALIAQPTGAADVQAAVRFARAQQPAGGGEMRRPQPRGTFDLRPRSANRPVEHARRARGPARAARLGRRRHAAGASRSRVHGLRTRDAARHGIAHRRGRSDHGRRIRTPGPQVRHGHRQPRVG